MPEPKNYVFEHTELAEILLKQANVHEGFWGIYLEFGFAGANMPTTPDAKTFSPAAITFINKIGIQRFDAPSNLTVDAAEINPLHGASKKKHRVT
ncbi:MAG: hypothetical protein JO051_14795 [Acidobacteriaceae bacterium]|nr:hypothetical protein [Acidobacteriaceae bacterium]